MKTPRSAQGTFRLLCQAFLFFIVVKNHGPVLCAFIHKLAVDLCWVNIMPVDVQNFFIGIPEVTGYLKGEYDHQRAKYLMKLHTRHYIKRQLTWFRRDKRLIWIDITPNQSAEQIADIIAGQI